MAAQTQQDLIKYYETRLKKVKEHHDSKQTKSSIIKERCREYIKFAKDQLRAVKAGRTW